MLFQVSILVLNRKPATLEYRVRVSGSASFAKKLAEALESNADVSAESVSRDGYEVSFATLPDAVSLRFSASQAWMRRVIYDVANTPPEYLNVEFVQPARNTEAVIADSTNSGESTPSDLSAKPQGVAVLDSDQMATLAAFLQVVAPDRSVTFEWDADGGFSVYVAAPRRD